MSNKLTAWDKVLLERFGKRPTALDYIENIFDEFIELHGDRQFADDKSIVCGLAKILKEILVCLTQKVIEKH